MQIRVIEHNDWEGETFSYILDEGLETVNKIQHVLHEADEFGEVWEIELNTEYTSELVNTLNKHSQNTYMDYIGFYEIPGGAEITEDLFYKGAGLNRVLKVVK